MGLEKETLGFETSLQIELVLSGSKSPTDPWQEYDSVPQGTHLLDENLIEKTFRIAGKAEKKWENLSVGVGIEYEHVKNPLKLAGEIYKPSEGEKSSTYISFEVSYSF